MSASFSIFKAATREYLTHDLGALKEPIARSVFQATKLIRSTGSVSRRARAFAWLMRLHSGSFSPEVDRRIVQEIRDATERERQGQTTGLFALYDQVIEDAVARLPDLKLLVVDPIGSYLEQGVDSHRDNDVRGRLRESIAWRASAGSP